jgi:hypothetical protein
LDATVKPASVVSGMENANHHRAIASSSAAAHWGAAPARAFGVDYLFAAMVIHFARTHELIC